MIFSSMKLLVFLNVTGSLVVMTSSSWFSVWIGIELTSMTMPSIMSFFDSSLVSKVNSWKYYMVQCYASSMFLLAILCMSFSSFSSSYSTVLWMIILTCMLFKMGIIPFQGWLFHISQSVSWITFLIISTIQKIGPLLIISECFKTLSASLQIDLLISSLISALSLSGLMVHSVRYFMMTSSMINSAWMIASSSTTKFSFIFFMVVYFFHLLILFNSFDQEFSNQLEMNLFIVKKHFATEMSKILTIMSLIGVPPLIGFFTKVSVIEQLIISNQLAVSMILCISSATVMLIYLKLVMASIFNMRVEIVQFSLHNFLSAPVVILLFSPIIFLM